MSDRSVIVGGAIRLYCSEKRVGFEKFRCKTYIQSTYRARTALKVHGNLLWAAASDCKVESSSETALDGPYEITRL